MSAASDRRRDQALLVPIEDVVAGYGITLRPKSGELVGPCPMCNDARADDRFSVKWVRKKELFYCRICKVGGDVIRLVERVENVDFKEAVKMLTRDDRPRPPPAVSAPAKPQRSDAERTQYAVDKWRKAHPASGTLIEVYLRSRGITLSTPLTLRFAPRLWHKDPDTDIITCWPAMIGLVVRGVDNVPIGIHRTYLARDGMDKAPVVPKKMGLGLWKGGCVRLAAAIDGHVAIGEGIETCLSVQQATGLPTWAALSAPGMCLLQLPDTIRRVTILTDADDDGEGEAAALDAGRRWKSEGRIVKIARPPPGKDFNNVLTDMLREGAATT